MLSSSVWPLVLGFGVLSFGSLVVSVFRGGVAWISIFTVLGGLIVLSYYWGRDIIREGSYLGCHISNVSNSVLGSMKLFIFSEVMFFSGFFWSFFYNIFDWDGDVMMSFHWGALDPMSIPLLNTILLLSSGITVTYGHHSMHSGEVNGMTLGILVSVVIGVIFLLCQYVEYVGSIFSMSDGYYSSIFFTLTGFHGFHVMVGCVGLIVSLLRNDVIFGKGVGNECFIWYWHFVDIVWVGLYVLVYGFVWIL